MSTAFMACVSIYKVAHIHFMIEHYFQSIYFKTNTIQLSQKKVKFYFPQMNTKLKITILRSWKESWKPAAFCALQVYLAKLPRTQQQILQGACCSIHSAKPQDQQRAQMEPSTCCTLFPGPQRRIWKAIKVFPPTTTRTPRSGDYRDQGSYFLLCHSITGSLQETEKLENFTFQL